MWLVIELALVILLIKYVAIPLAILFSIILLVYFLWNKYSDWKCEKKYREKFRK